MSWRDAKPLLENLGGPVAPYSWQGGLPLTYHVGPGPAKLRVQVKMDDAVRSIWVVTGRIRGSERPEESVILGNHRDSWAYGGVDPSSGSATLLETARVLGELVREGHRPKRSVLLASWDAEEIHLTGSTEWGEQFEKELSRGAVAYLNVDSSTSGADFSASAVASLNPLVESVLWDVIDPNTRVSLAETARRRLGGDEAGEEVEVIENRLGSGSDYTVFLNRLGVPIVDMTFDGPYGVYHSQYDNLFWMEKFGDPGYRYMTAMVEVWGRMALRLANAQVLPYDFGSYASRVDDFLDDLVELPGALEHLDLMPARQAVAAWETAADQLDKALGGLMAEKGQHEERYRSVNEVLLGIERLFLLEEGLPGRPWFKHALYAPRYTYAAMSLPGVTEAIEAGEWARADEQLELLVRQLRRIVGALESVRSEVTL
jgi:N-acetylated-alpha-linked acidic dipeptidase